MCGVKLWAGTGRHTCVREGSEAVKYFAYGSNMLESRLTQDQRIPSARFDAVGRLGDHALRFEKVGRDGSAKCNAPTVSDGTVYGVLFTVAEDSLDQLDLVEDVARGGYSRRDVEVELPAGAVTRAITYVAGKDHIRGDVLPLDWYQALVVAGAMEHDLPRAYIDRMRDIHCCVDLNTARRAAALELLGPFRQEFEGGRLTGEMHLTA